LTKLMRLPILLGLPSSANVKSYTCETKISDWVSCR
jgi:hypothetical protein